MLYRVYHNEMTIIQTFKICEHPDKRLVIGENSLGTCSSSLQFEFGFQSNSVTALWLSPAHSDAPRLLVDSIYQVRRVAFCRGVPSAFHRAWPVIVFLNDVRQSIRR